MRRRTPQLQLTERIINEDASPHPTATAATSRRLFFQSLSSMLLIPLNEKSANAACLSGDIRSDCIGVYKLPIDAPESSYVATPEKLMQYAPDIKWVPPVEYPANYADALKQLNDQRLQLDVVQERIAKRGIEGAGLVLLDISPKVNAAGIVILKSFGSASNKERNEAMKKIDTADFLKKIDSAADTTNNDDGNPSSMLVGNPSSTEAVTALEMRAYQMETTFKELVGFLGETDIMIGQGLRGDLGVSAPAQIQILSNISECRKEFDNMLSVVPEKVQ